jgi:hypothetical protein
VKDFNTGQLCQPWTYGPYALHIPNNVDYTVTPDNGKMEVAQGCTPISAADPQMRNTARSRVGSRPESAGYPGRKASLGLRLGSLDG